MQRMSLDIRKSTCPGGGAIWSLLSHTRDLSPGESIGLLTDDYLAAQDIPEWATRVGWTVTTQQQPDGCQFEVGRPA